MIGPDIPAMQRSQVGDPVDAAGVALLAHDQDGHDRGDRLRDDREIDAADPALEHRSADDEGEDRRHQDDRDQRYREAVERLPEERQRGELVPIHEIGDARRRLDLGVRDRRRLELEVHRHAVAAEAEEHALPQAQDAAIAPAQHEADPDEGIGQIFGDQVEAEDIERQRQDEKQQHRERKEAEQFGAIEKARVDDHDQPACSYLRTLSAKSPCGRTIRMATIVSSVITLAIDPDRKNSSVDWVCEIEKAEAMVPNSEAAPPNTTTRKVSTM
ncbi:hypothetical protein ABIF15_001108 [Bradyrhizobium elkanii]